MHPLYPHARRLIGQHVYVHAYGRVHHGILHQVTGDGVYLRPVGQTVSDTGEAARVRHLLLPEDEDPALDQVWWPFWFFPWWGIGALGPWWW